VQVEIWQRDKRDKRFFDGNMVVQHWVEFTVRERRLCRPSRAPLLTAL